MQLYQHVIHGEAIDHRDYQRDCLRRVEQLCTDLRRDLLDGDHPPCEGLEATVSLLVGTFQVLGGDRATQRLLRRMLTEIRTTGSVSYAGRPVSMI